VLRENLDPERAKASFIEHSSWRHGNELAGQKTAGPQSERHHFARNASRPGRHSRRLVLDPQP